MAASSYDKFIDHIFSPCESVDIISKTNDEGPKRDFDKIDILESKIISTANLGTSIKNYQVTDLGSPFSQEDSGVTLIPICPILFHRACLML